MRIVVGFSMTNWLFSRFGAFDNRMAYVVGLQRLGHEVYAFGEIDKKRCYDSSYNPVPLEEWEGGRRLERWSRAYGIWPRCSLLLEDSEVTLGMPYHDVIEVARTADVLININGRLKSKAVIDRIPERAYVDIDPSKTQVYHAEYGIDQGLEAHNHFFTVGLNVGAPSCPIPTCDREWHPLEHPVVLEHWPARIDERCEAFTSISSWEGKETFDFQGSFSGEKSDRWRAFISVPREARQKIHLSLRIDDAYSDDIKNFEDNGWEITNPQRLQSLEDYRKYVGESRAEFSVANHRYVQFRTGWFSDRTARYLASGKPALVQSTGVEDHLPTGMGLLTFAGNDDAVSAIGEINRNYLEHCRAARSIAEQRLDSDKVLRKLLETIGR